MVEMFRGGCLIGLIAYAGSAFLNKALGISVFNQRSKEIMVTDDRVASREVKNAPSKHDAMCWTCLMSIVLGCTLNGPQIWPVQL